ncbi:hypothetical protein K4L06_13280 [Lysobacter sp. BMK333-48F3]|uniref:hypothetical protein n=1 Tax=Lysobacter sp. BMK333-48F3 TaxID=2867962 RepID=UPI001C8C56F0|nr:hypothetical protein [Lysobacter sp. BMK333-48F3]MBX9402281.1 hypothetical protein [Lysobacter sp. BMK333-48F3]
MLMPAGTRWSSGDYVEIAVLSIEDSQLERALKAALLHGFEAGMGRWAAIGVRLQSGVLVELIRYADVETDRFALRVDRSAEPAPALAEVLAQLGLVEGSVLWVADAAKAYRDYCDER